MNNEHNFERYSSLCKLNNCIAPKNMKYFEKLFPALGKKKNNSKSKLKEKEKVYKFLSKIDHYKPIILPNIENDKLIDEKNNKIEKNIEAEDTIKILDNNLYEKDAIEKRNIKIKDLKVNCELTLEENQKIHQKNEISNFNPLEDKYRNLFEFLNKVKIKSIPNKIEKESIKSVRQNSVIGSAIKEENDFKELTNKVIINFDPDKLLLQKGQCFLPNINKRNKNNNRNVISYKHTNPVNEECPDLQNTLCINNVEISQNPTKLSYKNIILNKRKRIPTIIKKDRITINKTEDNLDNDKELVNTITTPKQRKLNTNKCLIMIKNEKSPRSQENISINDISNYQSLDNEEKRVKSKTKKLTSIPNHPNNSITQIKTHIKINKISENKRNERKHNNKMEGDVLFNLILKIKEDNITFPPTKINIIHQDYTIHKYHFLNIVFDLLNYFQTISIKNKDELNVPHILFLANFLNLPLNKKDINVIYLKSKENVLPIKERLLKILYDSINFSNKLFIPNTDQVLSSFIANIGKGNNSSLIKNLLKQRFSWTFTERKEKIMFNLLWTQWKKTKIMNTLSSKQINLYNNNDKNEKLQNSPKFKFKIFNPSSKIVPLNDQEENRLNCFVDKFIEILNKKEIIYSEEKATIKICNKLTNNYNLSQKKFLFHNLYSYYALLNMDPYDTLPRTYHVQYFDDEEWKRFIEYFHSDKEKESKHFHNVWIVKPGENSNRGNRIIVTKNLEDIKQKIPKENGKSSIIIQKYIERPLLINKRKFDIRCYCLITSINGYIKGLLN